MPPPKRPAGAGFKRGITSHRIRSGVEGVSTTTTPTRGLGRAGRRESTTDRRTEIAAAARALIAEKGFEGLRTRDIADRVGINIATLHYHVPNKEALIELVMQSAKTEFAAQSRETIREQMTSAEMLDQEIADFLDMIENRPELLAVMSEFTERSRRDPAVAKRFGTLLQDWVAQISGLLKRGIADGSFRANINPEIGATLFIGGLLGMAKLPALIPMDRRVYAKELARAFLNPAYSAKDD